MSKENEVSVEEQPPDVVEKAQNKVPWSTTFRKFVLVVLGSLSFILFLAGMWIRFHGGNIAYEDLFLLLVTSGTLLSVNFGLDILQSIAKQGGK